MPIRRTGRSVRSATLTTRRALPINRRRDHVADQRVAIYPGSFDPPTNGHLDIVDRGSRLFDRVVIGVGRNPSKKTVFTAEERVDLMQEACGKLKNVEVRTFDSLQVEFAREVGATFIIRGIRALSDFRSEERRAGKAW